MKQVITQVFDSLKKSALLTVMIILTFAAGLFLIGGTIGYINSSKKLSVQFEQVYSADSGRYSLFLRNYLGFGSQADGADAIRKLAQSYDAAKKEFGQYHFYNVCTTMLYIGDFAGPDSMLNGYDTGQPNRDSREVDGVKYSWLSALSFNQDFIDHFKLRISEGTDFSEWKDTVFNAGEGAEIPVILGSNYRGVYALGDILDGDISVSPLDFKLKLRVVGFFEKGCAFISYNTSADQAKNADLSKMFVYLDDKLVTPFINWLDYTPDTDIKYLYGNYTKMIAMQYSYVLMTADAPEGHPDAEVAKFINDYSGGKTDIVYGEIMDIPEAFYTERDLYFNLMLYSSIFIIFACVVCISINLTNKITSNLKKYAVHLVSGASLGTLRSFAVGEVVAVTLAANILAFAGLALFGGKIFTYGSSTYELTLSGISAVSVLAMLGVDLCVLVLSLAYPLRKIDRTEYDTLLRGDE